MPPLLDAPTLMENISQLGTADLVFVAVCLAAAFYFAVEGFVSDFAESEYVVVSGKVTDSSFNFGEDSSGFIVEFRAESGQMHMIEEVRHPWRALKIGGALMVRYPRSHPDRAKPEYSPLTSSLLKLFKIGAALMIAYSVASRGG